MSSQLLHEDGEAYLYVVGDGTVNIVRKEGMAPTTLSGEEEEEVPGLAASLTDRLIAGFGSYQADPSGGLQHELSNEDMNISGEPEVDSDPESEDGAQAGLHIVTDADVSHRCTHARRFVPDQAAIGRYVENLRKQWLDDGGDPKQTIEIPAGYELAGIVRQDGTTKDYFLFGHPRRYTFRSTRNFYLHLVHLIHLTNHPGVPHNCRCLGC